ncbi:chondroitinase family polysaccharide lyase [Avibacterium volantium]|uniref:Chondroitin sulfate ABC lyase n=1 Tax=Avibacterium volantium TaxID=762 RepID=A0A3S4HHY8_AVIVO|nr:chondroitinase family polysaccharide lyase [Avibacterium volantium]VEB22329.1 Chondroitin sulfate ABC endolyase precursor [Avibacterium volantium]
MSGKMKKLNVSLLALSATFMAGSSLASETRDPNNIMQAKIEPFVNSAVLKDFTVSKGSELSLTDLRSITGKTSLEWNWTAGSSIVFHRDYYVPSDAESREAWGRGSTPLFSFFIYNETPIDDYLIVDLGQGVTAYNNGDAGLRVKLDFKGWRAVGVSLNNDMEYREMAGSRVSGGTQDGGGDGPALSISRGIGSKIDSIRFMAPRAVKKGRFFIDHIMLSVDDFRYQWSDYHVKTRITEPEVRYKYSPLPKVSAAQLQQDLNTVETRFKDFLLYEADPRFKENINFKDLKQKFDSFTIRKSADGVITGRHVLTGKQKNRYQMGHMKPEDKKLFDEYIDLADYSTLMYNISRAYNKTRNNAERQQLANMYILLTEHLIDQGFYKGSGLITTHHWGYSSRWWYLSAFLMRDVLAQANLQKTIYDALLWYAREFKDSFDMVLTPDSSNLDYYNTLARQHLALLFLETDAKERGRLVASFANYISGSLSQNVPGSKDGLRADGTAWRHNGHYPGYAFPAFPNTAGLAYLFSGTAFAVKDEAYHNLKKALVSAWIYSNPNTGISISGRHPFATESLNSIADSYRWLALANKGKVDTELAGIYLTLAGKTAKQSAAIFKQEIAPAKLPQGFWAFNGGAFGIHRFNDKMVTLKTYNSNVWSSEIYFEENRYGRYQSNGSAQILSHKKPSEQGFVEAGWDWNRLPGITAIHLPFDKLNSPVTHTLMLRGETPYNGTSSLQQKYGMMASLLLSPSGMTNFDSKFTAKKTVLAADDHLIMVGTDIRSSNNNKDVETTLFQLSSDSSGNALLNGKTVSSSSPLSFKTGDWLIDGDGNGYLITNAPQGYVVKQKQKSIQGEPDKRYVGMARKETQGVFSSAWLDHSQQGNNAGYEYLVILDATPSKMQNLASQLKSGNKPYEFSAQSNAHIVKDRLSQVNGYAFYKSGNIEDDLVKSANMPAIVMTKQDGDALVVSGVTTNLNIVNEKRPKPLAVKVTLNGVWKVKQANPKVKVKASGSTTELVFSSFFGIPEEILLYK